MRVLKCAECGGEMEIDESLTIGKCKYCEAVNIIPKNMEKLGNLYNRATYLRQNNEFDKAIEVYEDILKENNEEAEAHWGLVLCKYGIEYVDDPKSGAKKPTIHRIRNKSILEDTDYKMAMQYGDIDAEYQYEKKGNEINHILMRYLEVARNEKPYDIFICYKENDDIDNRTEDSVIAQNIYRALEKEGYKVFFARKTLEGKIGEEYEPIIYAALSSAKVMFVVGTRIDYLQAPWVKNEWSRFNELKENDSKKMIIPCYKNISPYDLPMEIANYQALDVGKIGFLQDLTDGVEKIFSRRKKTESFHSDKGQDVDKLCRNAETFLKLNQEGRAMSIYKSIIVSDPDDYRGWWGIATIISNDFQDYETTRIEEIKQNMNNAIKVAEERDARRLQKKYDEYVKKYEQIKKEKDERQAEEERERRRLLAEQEEERKRLLAEQKRKEKINELTIERKQLEQVVSKYYDQSAEISKHNDEIRLLQQKLIITNEKINNYEKYKTIEWSIIVPCIHIGLNIIPASILVMMESDVLIPWILLCVILFKPAIMLGQFIDGIRLENYEGTKRKKQRIESELKRITQIISEIQNARMQNENRKKRINELSIRLQQLQFAKYTE